VLGLDDFLVLRAVELIVHADDLAITIGARRPRFAELIERAVIYLLVDTAIVRHGRQAVVTALTRRERDTTSALSVI
jgi:hypothetical protein